MFPKALTFFWALFKQRKCTDYLEYFQLMFSTNSKYKSAFSTEQTIFGGGCDFILTIQNFIKFETSTFSTPIFK